MVSSIDPGLINENYPNAGVDQSSQGFRDNFLGIKNNFSTAKGEIEALQAVVIPTVLDDLNDVDTTTTAPSLNNVLAFNGSEWVPAVSPSSELVNDTSPQLGGDLDTNGFSITGPVVINPSTGVTAISRRVSINDNNVDGFASLQLVSYSDLPTDSGGAFLSLRRARGAVGSESSVVDTDKIMDFAARGYDGTDFQRNFEIIVTATENHSGTNRGVNVRFESSANTESTPSTRLEFTNTGSVKVSDSYELPTADGSSGYVMKTGGAGIVSFDPPTDLGEFTVAGLPSAATHPNSYALATDASGGRTIVRSDGTDWKVVAVEGSTVTT